VQKIRKCHEEPVGHGHKQIHITLQIKDDRYLDIVFDTRKVG
jgi:translation elongation factor EF-1beta